MDNSKTIITKEQVMSYFDKWESVKPEIQELYDQKQSKASESMAAAIANYEELLGICAPAGGSDRRTKMEPLNGEERLQFIKDKVVSPFALIQLNLLYTELRKKIARFIAN